MRLGCLAAACLMLAGHAAAQTGNAPTLQIDGVPSIVFDPARDACDGDNVPDVPARAFRDADGDVAMFALHFENRALRGPNIGALKLDCRVVFRGSGAEDPKAYDDRAWIAATWTRDGRAVAALIHHEYQGNTHPGRCTKPDYLSCWWNSVLGATSGDGGRTFMKGAAPVVAATPFGQEAQQGRHRGFFNPSNMFGRGTHVYMFASTTGWQGQDGGVCLFRTETPEVASSWRAFDGKAFTASFPDPYGGNPSSATTCRTIAPFPAPVGSVTRHRASGQWIAVFQAWQAGTTFPVPGFYWASSADLITWSAPRLLIAGKTLYDDPCQAGGALIAYPSLIDPKAEGRNFDDVGDVADLYYSHLRTDGCTITSDRKLLRQTIRLVP